MTTAAADQAARDQLERDFERTLFVEAGAGTGKTTAVVARIVARVGAGLPMEGLVAITFTIAAAGELRVRIREALERAALTAATPEASERMRRAAAEVDRARIETIHAFCSALLHMHPLEAGLPPNIEMLVDIAADIDVRERFRHWFDNLRTGDAGAEAVRRGLLLGMRPDQLLQLFIALNRNWDMIGSVDWTAPPVAAAREARAIGGEIEECIAMLPLCKAQDDPLRQRVDSLRVVASRLCAAEQDDDALAALIALGAPKLGSIGRQANWKLSDGKNACTVIRTTMKQASEQATQLLTDARAEALGRIGDQLRHVVLGYAEERRQSGLVSYQDLLVRARDLIRDHPEVRHALREQWQFIAVDEFQDTDPLQAELAFRLCAGVSDRESAWQGLALDPGRLCVVGDPKQSIYRFRRADIALYSAVERNLIGADPQARVRLSVNFRSGRRIIDAVNTVFGGEDGLMLPSGAAPGVQATHVDLSAHAPHIEGTARIYGEAVTGRASVMWRREAQATAALVKRVIAERWTVGEGTREGAHPCTANDIAILMPSRTNLRNLERELETARIPYRLESGSLIVATQEVRDLLNILRSLDDPTDQVALVATLRSPAYGCSDVELVRWRASGGRWSYTRPGDGAAPRVIEALADLRELHGLRHGMSVPGLIDEVLARRLLRAAALDDWRPRETAGRYRFVADEARALARSGRSTLHDAVDYLEQLSRDPQYDSVAGDDGSEDAGVRVMTVHAAKGLEFPIVIVTGLGRKPSTARSLIVADNVTGQVELRLNADSATAGWKLLDARERNMETAERVRVLYVALTRARDHLVVSVFRGAGNSGEQTDAGRLAELLPRCPGVERLDDTPLTIADRARPDDGDGVSPEQQRLAERVWVARRAELLARFSALRTQSATSLMPGVDGDPVAATDITASRRGRGATSLGRAVHSVLQLIDLTATDGIETLARAHAAAEGVPERSGEVVELVRSARNSDSVRQAAGLRHWRELPVGASVDGVVLEGFVDLLYELPDGRLVIVDYKTDAVTAAGVDARMAHHRLQGGVYALLVGQVTGRKVARIEFVFAAPGETRTVTDVSAAIAEVRSRLLTGGVT